METMVRTAFVWALAFLLGAPDVTAQSRMDGLRELVEAERRAQKIPGLSIALVVEDQLVWSEGFGFADIESGSRATGATVYRIGSISKPIVATGLMQLVEQDRVDLDVDIRTYLPEWPEKRWPITTRHLLTHTSGIRHYGGTEFLSRELYTDLVAPLEVFKDDPLLFEPGTKFSYSTYGFNLVANIIERVSGQRIEEYMRTHVFEPAWMNDTGLESWGRIQKGRSRWYARVGDDFVNTPYVDLSNKYAGGGLTATVEDLARLHLGYARGRLLKPATIEQMTTRQQLSNGSTHDWALGWRVDPAIPLPDGSTARRVSHSGGSIGATSLFWRFPERGLALALVTNVSSDRGKILQGVLTRVLKPEGREPAGEGDR